MLDGYWRVLVEPKRLNLPPFFFFFFFLCLELLSSAAQRIPQAVPVIGLLFIAMGYVGSTRVCVGRCCGLFCYTENDTR